MNSKYEAVIGLEVHAQLLTKSKLFCGDEAGFGAEPNRHISPITLAHPGTLPKMNKEAIELAVRMGLACNCEIEQKNYFARKHYFYPDLPNGYQITQMYQPTILAGHVDAPLEDGSTVRVRVHHAHIEADAGKLTHYGDYSLVDLNRAGTPLIEIVSEPAEPEATVKRYALSSSNLPSIITEAPQ